MLSIPAQATRLDIAAVHVTSSPAIKIALIKGLPLVDEKYSYKNLTVKVVSLVFHWDSFIPVPFVPYPGSSFQREKSKKRRTEVE